MSDHLPPPIVEEILYRLPVEALVKCTAVCKSWNTLIKSPTFISTLLERTISSNNPKDTHLLLFRVCTSARQDDMVRYEEHYSLRFDNEDVDAYKQLSFPFRNQCRNDCFSVVGSCNGLVCLADYLTSYVETFILWNPIIQKAVLVPRPNVTFRSHGAFDASLGFGFDSKTNDYKLLRFVDLHDRRPQVSVEVELYSLNANCWKSITHIAPKYGVWQIYRRLYGHSFVNGKIHLLAYECDSIPLTWFRPLILAFDVCEEVFNEIALPQFFSDKYMLLSQTQLLKYGKSSIGTVLLDWDGRQIGLWVMKEYGVATSWTKMLNEVLDKVPRVLLFRENEEALVTMRNGLIASLDMKRQRFGVLGVNSPAQYASVDSFVESLVLIDKGKHASAALLGVSDGSPEEDASSADKYTDLVVNDESSEEDASSADDWDGGVSDERLEEDASSADGLDE